MAVVEKIVVFKDHDNNYWLDADGSVPFPENSVVYRRSTDFPERYFADQELTVEWALEWLPRTVEVYPRRVLGKPVFAYQNFPAVSSGTTSPSHATMSPTCSSYLLKSSSSLNIHFTIFLGIYTNYFPRAGCWCRTK
ncbi:uncharacterized protein LOC119572305 isoform X2 [Penaeus monodon]|uniref:uncharacterized protein LOC119572305 isoform X2 n=1 Tax=Penaeus monodon TaxID=6687 RepID=UPI0018A7AF5D|nr:uncharacterized protein LOC119572305 isoform X2 [Penaeus monodon]